MRSSSFSLSPLFLLLSLLSLLSPSLCSVIVLTNNVTYPDRIAAFGPRINSTGVTGILISMHSWNASNVLGCSDMIENPNVTNWIALVERGDCTFLEKVRAMQNAGAIAVIVGDNKPSNALVTMYATEDSSDIVIPSVFVSKVSYESLVIQAAPFNDIYSLPVYIDNKQIIEWPMLDIVIVTIIAPAVIMIFLYSIWRFRRRNQQKREVAPPSVVISLPVRTYQKPENRDQEGEETCPICLEDFKEGDELRILPCKHEYHVSCVDQWLTTRKRFCPLCKVDACPDAATEESRLVIRNLFSSRPTTSADSSDPTGMHLQEDQRNNRVEQDLSSPVAPSSSSSPSSPPSSSSPSTGNQKGYTQVDGQSETH